MHDDCTEQPMAKKIKNAATGRITKINKTAKKTVKVAANKPAQVASAPEPELVNEKNISQKDSSSRRKTAQELAVFQKEISVAEFFTKNRHLLGFDNPRKALLTAVKEAVDNALDACEEARILPELYVEIKQTGSDRYLIIIEDNGPGIVRAQIPRIFGKLLYGSKFHRLKQSRGQQGIGISASAMYGQLTTGMPCRITSKTGKKYPAHYFEIKIDTKKNNPDVLKDETIQWEKEHGTRVEIELDGVFQRGKRSVEEYLEQVLIANPHVCLIYKASDVEEAKKRERSTDSLPVEPLQIKPHPYGIELGVMIDMLKTTKARHIKSFFQTEFCKVGPMAAENILKLSGLKEDMKPRSLNRQQAEGIYRAIQNTKIPRPPTNCLSPIGEEQLLAGLKRSISDADWYSSVSRPPAVYRGNSFLVEAAIAWGGPTRSSDEPAELLRFANKVPLQHQQSACSITKSVIGTSWKLYGLAQPKGALPIGPLVIAVHIASVWVPFTSESKESIASYPEIMKEIKLALQECGRRLGMHIRKRDRIEDAEKKKNYIKTYIPQLVLALQDILKLSDRERDKTVKNLTDILEKSRKII